MRDNNISRLFRTNLVNFNSSLNVEEQVMTSTLNNILEDPSVVDTARLGKEYVDNVKSYNNQMILFAKYIKSLCFHDSIPGLIVYGMPGLGKTYQVKSQLDHVIATNPNKVRYKYFKGKITATQLYINAYFNRTKGTILVFDDCDNVFNDQNSMNILKAMTDTYDRRMVSYASPAITSQDVPIEFEFEGKVILITNQDIDSNPHMDALTSRMLPITVEISPIEVIAKSIDNLIKSNRYANKKRVVTFIARFIWNNREVFEVAKYSLRTSQQLIQIYELMDYNYEDFIMYCKKFLRQFDWSKIT